MVSEKIKLIRVESEYTQEKMADILGISKKQLVQIEKGRLLAGWTVVVAVAALFQRSGVLQSVLGSEPLELMETLAHESVEIPREKTLGGKVWWLNIETTGNFRLQQNIISKHYRILDHQDYRWYSTFEQDKAVEFLHKIAGERNE